MIEGVAMEGLEMDRGGVTSRGTTPIEDTVLGFLACVEKVSFDDILAMVPVGAPIRAFREAMGTLVFHGDVYQDLHGVTFTPNLESAAFAMAQASVGDLKQFRGVQTKLGHWGEVTFPAATPMTTLRHMQKEARELEDDIAAGAASVKIAEEAADCVILAFGLAHRCQFDLGLCVVRVLRPLDLSLPTGAHASAWCSTRFPRATPASLAQRIKALIDTMCLDMEDGASMADIERGSGELVALASTLVEHFGENLLFDAIERKYAIIQKRVWGQPGPDGVVEHLREYDA